MGRRRKGVGSGIDEESEKDGKLNRKNRRGDERKRREGLGETLS